MTAAEHEHRLSEYAALHEKHTEITLNTTQMTCTSDNTHDISQRMWSSNDHFNKAAK